MKKKLLSIFALSMCVCLGAGAFAGCKDKKKDKDKDNNQPLTQEQILEKVKEGLAATKAYTGARTATIVSKETEEEVNGTEKSVSTYESTEIASVDVAAKKMYMKETAKETEGEETETSEYISKLFKDGDKYYAYMKQAEGEESQEQYMGMSESYVAAALANTGSEFTDSSYYEEFEAITTLEAYNAAYATIFADSKAAIAAGTADETSRFYKMSADGSCVVSCAEVEGAYVLTMKMSMTGSRDTTTMSMSNESILTVKDGKVVSLVTKEASTEAETVEGVTNSETESEEKTITLTYAFDDAAYNAVTTTVPAEVQQMPDMFSSDVEVVINGVSIGEQYPYGMSAKEALASIYVGGSTVVWYKDAACTQAIADDMSMADFMAMKTVYGKATAPEGQVVYVEERVSVFASDVPDAYKLIFGAMVKDSYGYVSTTSVEGGIHVSVYDDGMTVTVNGTAVTFAEGENYKIVPVEAGQSYVVKYTSTYTKADMNIFMMM